MKQLDFDNREECGLRIFDQIRPLIDKVPGFLVPGQERWLFNAVRQLPDDAVILEIGSFLGRSTTAMAFACRGTRRHIHAVDTFKGNDSDFIKGVNKVSWEGDDYLGTFEANLSANDLLDYVTPHQGLSHDVIRSWTLPIDFAFIDGSHVFEDVLRDFENVYSRMKPGGQIAFHDVLPDWQGPYRAWHEHIRQHVERPSHFFSIAFGRKPVRCTSYSVPDPCRHPGPQSCLHDASLPSGNSGYSRCIIDCR